MLIYRKVGPKIKFTVNHLHTSILFLLFIQPFAFVCGQDSTCVSAPPLRQIKTTTIIDFFTTFAGISFINGQTSDERNSLYLYYNLTVNNKVKYNNFIMTNYYFTEFGIKKYVDSITSISEDQYNFKNAVSYRFGKSKFLFNLSTNAKSQYFVHYDYRTDSTGNIVRYTYTDYRSPGYKNYSCGIKYELNEHCFFEFGLVNGRKTMIRNQNIFTSREANQLYGLKKGTSQKTEFGLNLVITVLSHEIVKNLYVENFSQFNVNKTDLRQLMYYKADINNAFHYKFLKHFRATLRTKILYDFNINSKPKLINSLTLGFYLNNVF